MRTSNSMAILAGVAVAVLLVAAHAQAITDVAYNFPTGLVGNETDPQAHILGNEFTVNSAINVTAVGAFASGGSLGATIPVAMYQLTSGTWYKMLDTVDSFSGNVGSPLLSAPTRQVGSALMQDLNSPVPLTPGGTYAIVAANYGVAGALDWNVLRTYTTVPTFQTESSAITMGNMGSPPETALFGYGATLDATITLSGGNWGNPTPAFAGATFEFEPVPEAATFGAAGVGLLALVYIGRYARLRSKVTPA
jgi:hypothetical protein